MVLLIDSDYERAYAIVKQICDEKSAKNQVSMNGNTFVGIIEEYTLRNGNYMTVTLILYEEDDTVFLHIIGSGASSGLLNIEWGANDSREKKYAQLISSYNLGYKIIA